MTLSTIQELPNRVGPGVAQVGSTDGIDSGDPLRPVWSGEHYLYMTGVSGNGNVTPGTGSTVVGSNAYSIYARKNGTYIGYIAAANSADRGRFALTGTNATVEVSDFTTGAYVALTLPTTLPPASYNHWLVDIDAAAGTARFRASTQSIDTARADLSWDFDDIAAHTGPVRAVAAGSFSAGATGTSGPGTGALHQVDWEVSGVADMSFHPGRDVDTLADPDAGQASWTSATGEIWTVTRSTSGLATVVVTSARFAFDGSDDRIMPPADVAPALNGQPTTFMHVVSGIQPSASAVYDTVFGNRPNFNSVGTPGVSFGSFRRNPAEGREANLAVSDGVTEKSVSVVSSAGRVPWGIFGVIGWRYDAIAETIECFTFHGGALHKSGTTSVSALGSCLGASDPTIGCLTNGTLPFRGEMKAPFIKADAFLDDSEVSVIAAKLLSGAYA